MNIQLWLQYLTFVKIMREKGDAIDDNIAVALLMRMIL